MRFRKILRSPTSTNHSLNARSPLGNDERGFGSHPCRVVSSSYQKMVHCHGRGREFESRRPRHSNRNGLIPAQAQRDPKGIGSWTRYLYAQIAFPYRTLLCDSFHVAMRLRAKGHFTRKLSAGGRLQALGRLSFV